MNNIANLKSRIKSIVLVVLIAFLLVAIIGGTYARYTSTASGTGSTQIAKWAVKINNVDILTEDTFTVNLAEVPNDNVVDGKIAPSSMLYTDFEIDPTGSEVAIDYSFEFGEITSLNDDLSANIKVSKVCYITETKEEKEIEADADGAYTGTIDLVSQESAFTEDSKVKVRVYVEWIDEQNSNANDTLVGSAAPEFTMKVTGIAKQHIEDVNSEIENKKVISNISYTETTETKERHTEAKPVYAPNEQDVLSSNAEKGFYNTSNLTLNENGSVAGWTATKSNTSNLLYLKVDLSAFSGSMNGTGKDKELTDKAIEALENVLNQIKQNNNTVILRFVYDNKATGIIEGVAKVEPAQEMLLKHIKKLSSTFKKYSSTINVIQTGFYGLWGEAYYNTDAASKPEYYKQTVQALLDATEGTEITIAVRTSEYYSWYKGIDIDNIDDEKNITTSSDEAYRVGIFNDAYGASENDLGTYKNRQKEIEWLTHQTTHTYYGGEALPDTTSSNAVNGIGPYNTAMKFIEEAFKLHTSYINWEWNQALHKEWANQTYTGDDPYYSGKSALTYIENHLGYRLVVKEVKTYEKAESRETLPIDITINNVGFANVIKGKQADIIITDTNGNAITTYSNVNINAKDFISQRTIKKSVNIDLPELSAGEYQIYLRFSSGEVLDNSTYYSSIRFANDNMYSDKLQANRIASFIVE